MFSATLMELAGFAALPLVERLAVSDFHSMLISSFNYKNGINNFILAL